MANLGHAVKVAGPKEPGSGWAIALNSGGYPTPAYHFYPKGETKSVCQVRYRRYKIQVPEGQLPKDARKCKGCQTWVSGHPDGGVHYSQTKASEGRKKWW